MANSVPYEVIAAPFSVWVAAVATAFPALNSAPGVGWSLVGTSGPLNYEDSDGVTVEHSQSMNFWRSHGDTGSRKVFRSEEDLKVRLVLADLTLEQYSHAINSNTVTDSGTERSIGLSRNFGVATRAVLVRAEVSPYVANGRMQYQVWRAAQSGNPTVVYRKAQPAGLALEWTALVDPAQAPTEYFGKLVIGDTETT